MKERARLIQQILDEHFPNPKSSLFYRDPYTLLVAVLLSARNTDLKVNQVTPSLFSKAPTPEKMVELTIAEIQALIKPCGLYLTKAKNIWKLSHCLIHYHRGKVPRSLKALEALPGVGHKTASVVMALAFGYPTFPVDTHIFRSAHRWGLTSAASIPQVEKELKKLFPRKSWNRLHLQIIHFCRQYCPARGPHLECPICTRLLF